MTPMADGSDKMNVFDFGRGLLRTLDLDPTYVLLWEAGLRPPEMRRWLMAYFCFYHVGTASWATGDEDAEQPREGLYWDRMEQAAGSKDWPRCHERRHFRGQKAVDAVRWLRARGLGRLFAPLLLPRQYTLREVTDYVSTWEQFGSWVAFKVADMLERLSLARVAFDDGAMFLFKSPRQGAQLMWEHNYMGSEGPGRGVEPAEPVGGINRWAVDTLLAHLRPSETLVRDGRQAVPHRTGPPTPRVTLDPPTAKLGPEDKLQLEIARKTFRAYRGYAPPRYERPVNAQEAETILCKWKSHMGGHYRLGEDVVACRQGLLWAAKCPLAQRLLAAGKRGGLWT